MEKLNPMISESDMSELEPKSILRFSPWIITVLSLIYLIIVQFLLIASLEEAFPVFETFFENISSNIWLVEIPLPLIIAVVVYFYSQRSKTTNVSSLIFWSVALGTVLMGLIIYAILYQYPISSNSDFNFIFISTIILISLGLSIITIGVRKQILNRKTLHEGPMTGK